MTENATIMIDATMRLFKGVLANDHCADALFMDVNAEAIKYGLLAPKEACSDNLLAWFKHQKAPNRNTTFYKKWIDVTSKDRFELFIDQITHYLSTYGTDFEGEAYVPNDEPEVIPFNKYKVIKSFSRQEIISKCEKLVSTNVALDQNSVKDILTIFKELSHQIDVSTIKNKEFLMHTCDINNTIPKEPVEMVRFLVFKSIEQTLLIKDRATLKSIRVARKDLSNVMQDCGLEKLASVFYRFKPIFLALKANKNNASCINKIRKLANKHHKPMEIGYFESLLSTKKDLDEVAHKLETLNNFKKINLLNTILNRLNNQSEFTPYLVRNGKLYVRDNSTRKRNIDNDYLKALYNIIYTSLIKEMAKKACKVVLPETISIAMPTSSKKFIGEVPIGSSINLDETDNIIGIHWREKDGANDIDLSNIDIEGSKIGWNSGYYTDNNSIIYSGDMTSARPEATELLYTSGNFKPSIINVNLYNGAKGSKFEFFVAQEHITDLRCNHMVDPNNIVFKTPCSFEGEKEKIIGITTKKKFVFQSMKINTGTVSSGSEWKKGYIEYIVNSIENNVMLKDVFKDAGFEFVKETDEKTIDLSNFSKEQILNLVS